MFIITSV